MHIEMTTRRVLLDNLSKEKEDGVTLVKGDLVRLRPVMEKDLAQLIEWDENDEICRWAGKKFGSGVEAREWYLGSARSTRKTFAIETLSGELIGEVEILNISWRLHMAELRVFIGKPSMWNHGFGTDAVKTFLRWVFKNTSLKTVFLRVDKENHRARRCYEKAGFVPKGWIKLDSQEYGSGTLILMEASRETLKWF